MDSFKTNKIYLDSETIAEQLRRARQEKNLKLKDAAKKLNIREKYLAALEKGEYLKLPRGVYGKNFLREYALFLGLNYNRLAKDYETEINILEPRRQKELFAKQVVKKHYLLAMPKIFRNTVIFLIALVCFFYLGFRLNKIIAPPALVVSSPATDFTTLDPNLTVQGKTEVGASLVINGETVLSDKNGDFSRLISLKNGLNVITVTAKKQYGRDSTVTRQILLNQAP